MNYNFLLGVIKAAAEAPALPTAGAVPQVKKFTDIMKPQGGLTNAFSIDGLTPDRGQGLVARTTQVTQPNTLNVEAHGSGGPGAFQFEAEPSAFRSALPVADRFREHLDGPPELKGDLPGIASALGPATNNVHNFQTTACNAGGGLCPEEVRKYFPNVTNVIQTPKGALGPFVPKVSAPELAQSLPGSPSISSGTNRVEIDSFVDHLNRTANVGKLELPHQYQLQGTNWVDKGKHYY